LEEERAAVGLDYLASAVELGTQEFRLHSIHRGAAKVHRHEGSVPPGTEIVQSAGRQLLARADLPGDQDIERGVHQAGERPVHLLHRRRATDQGQAFVALGLGLGAGLGGMGRASQGAPGDRDHVVQIEGLGHIVEGADLGGVHGRQQGVLRAHDDGGQLRPQFF
jgi:hypothetical protein